MIPYTYINSKNTFQILRRHDVLKILPVSKSGLRNKILEGTFPPPISLGYRSVGFVQSECEITLQSMIAGHTSEQLKALVEKLIANRSLNLEEV